MTLRTARTTQLNHALEEGYASHRSSQKTLGIFISTPGISSGIALASQRTAGFSWVLGVPAAHVNMLFASESFMDGLTKKEISPNWRHIIRAQIIYEAATPSL